MDNLTYYELKTQEYLLNNNITVKQAQIVFSYRVTMAEYSENYRGSNYSILCPLCYSHIDSQALCYSCSVIKENVDLSGQYSDIFETDISEDVIQCFQYIEKYREQYLNSRSIEVTQSQ